jgi:rhamnose utilization protein RhaD (predicted bifunctional aldolase and dehydrogenase)
MLLKSDVQIQIENMCVSLATNPLLVQGAGGNVSWKEDDKLWIKASGTWLSDAAVEDIFIPTDLNQILNGISANNFGVTPRVMSTSLLKPSIETVLHALMPQRIVVHLHPIEILSYLVRKDCEEAINGKLSKSDKYAFVSYCHPGVELAEHVFKAINQDINCNIVFLKNHGLVIAGESVEEVERLLYGLLSRMVNIVTVTADVKDFSCDVDVVFRLSQFEYSPVQELNLHSLSKIPALLELVENKWALCPDHVVFLGAKAFVGDIDCLIELLSQSENNKPAFVFCRGVGTFKHTSLSRAQADQLTCFYDVAIRQNNPSNIAVLSEENINALLNWDAEKYRQSIAK